MNQYIIRHPGKLASIALQMVVFLQATAQNQQVHHLSRAEYSDKVEAVWLAQIIAVNLGWQFEHKQAAVKWVDDYPEDRLVSLRKNGGAPLDDDWYYEMAALRAFEKHGVGLSVQELGKQWVTNRVGTWGSSEMARLNLEKGIEAPASGHPQYNRLWFTMGNQCRGDLFGLLAPGIPNVAAQLSDKLGHINSYAEGADGGVMVSAMVSLAFFEEDPKQVVRQAAQVLHPDTPHRQCIDMIIHMAEAGKTAREIFNAVEDRWHIEYPATNNSVSNLGLAVTALWFGEGDFMKSLNLAYGAADFTDADCNGAVAGAVVAAMHGTKALPQHLVTPLQNRIRGEYLGPLQVMPAVDISISELVAQTVMTGEAMLKQHGAKMDKTGWRIQTEHIRTRPAELFSPNQFAQYWNPDWTLERAGYGAPGGGHRGIRGGTFVDGDVLATFPRDETRGVVLRRTLKIEASYFLTVMVGADPGRAWKLEIMVDHQRIHTQLIDGGEALTWEGVAPVSFPPPTEEYLASSKSRRWYPVRLDLSRYSGQEVIIRLYHHSLVRNRYPGNAYWKDLRVLSGKPKP
jgi:hypothetical protein